MSITLKKELIINPHRRHRAPSIKRQETESIQEEERGKCQTGLIAAIDDDMKLVKPLFRHILKKTYEHEKALEFAVALKEEKLTAITDATDNSINAIRDKLKEKHRGLTASEYLAEKNRVFKKHLTTCMKKPLEPISPSEWESIKRGGAKPGNKEVFFQNYRKNLVDSSDNRGFTNPGLTVKFVNLYTSIVALEMDESWFEGVNNKVRARSMIVNFLRVLQDTIHNVEREVEDRLNMCGPSKKELYGVAVRDLISHLYQVFPE